MITRDEIKEKIKASITDHVYSNPIYLGMPGTLIFWPWVLDGVTNMIEPLLIEIDELKKLEGLQTLPEHSKSKKGD
jgi:hypothetical protein